MNEPLPPRLIEDIRELGRRGLRPGEIGRRVGVPFALVVQVLYPPGAKP